MKLILIVLLFSTQLMAGTTAYFADLCSGEKIHIATPNGTTLYVALEDLDPEEDVELSIKFRPAGEIEDLEDRPQELGQRYVIKKKNILNRSYQGYFKIPKARWMWQVEARHGHYRIWDAEVMWVQPQSRKSGSTLTSFYRSEANKSYFKLNSPGLCQWEEEAEIDSQLYENNTAQMMNVIREDIQTWDKYSQTGLTLGYNNNHGGTLAIGANGSNNFGWLFKDWQKQINNQQIIKIERKFVLNKNESGIFITRMSYNRHEVTRYEWNANASQCGRYEPVSQGYLDIGINAEDFIVLPRHIYPREDLIKEFIKVIRPPVANCLDSIDLRPQVATDAIPSGINGILYYYETQRGF